MDSDNVVPISKLKLIVNKIKNIIHPSTTSIYLDEMALISALRQSPMYQAWLKQSSHELNMMSWEWDLRGNKINGISLTLFKKEE